MSVIMVDLMKDWEHTGDSFHLREINGTVSLFNNGLIDEMIDQQQYDKMMAYPWRGYPSTDKETAKRWLDTREYRYMIVDMPYGYWIMFKDFYEAKHFTDRCH